MVNRGGQPHQQSSSRGVQIVGEEEGSQVNAFVAEGLSPSAISNRSTSIEPAKERSSVQEQQAVGTYPVKQKSRSHRREKRVYSRAPQIHTASDSEFRSYISPQKSRSAQQIEKCTTAASRSHRRQKRVDSRAPAA